MYLYSCLRYAACKAHVLYFHLWPVLLYQHFPRYVINGAILGTELLDVKYLP